ncbi:MAG: UxaA family hydrolase [Armatimonadota bacterium]
MKLLRIHPLDNVAVALAPLSPGEEVNVSETTVRIREEIGVGHKVALTDLSGGQDVIKYGAPIGHATAPIPAGGWVHTHNLVTNLGDLLEYTYTPITTPQQPVPCDRTFQGYLRADGTVGIRNEVWIIPTVGCVNRVAERLAQAAGDNIFAFPHPYGCSQLGGDHLTTQRILAGLVHHPNAAGVLVVGLGCENNHLDEFRKVLGATDPNRVKFLNCQDVEDEYEEGLRLLDEISAYAATFTRQPIPVSKLIVGLKCGGSDAFSGITANPLAGAFSDLLSACGGATVLTETPEMFGAEHLLMNRCTDRAAFEKTVAMINDFKAYFLRHGQTVYENPSPGNKAGGISTLEEKSLGCTQKAGTSPVTDVLDYGDRVTNAGVNLLAGPGNDIVAQTVLAAAGAHLILFTTGRGTPLGSPVPTVKIATNSALAARKPHWIDVNAGVLLEGTSMTEAAGQLFNTVLEVASGQPVKNELNGFREIAIFKDGVTL